ncbi:MAG: rhomboid family intramembrane serine protease [Acidimicrobiales bacterium]|nr:rhomboid family intramembrane serine protease [Acidimicrobiales bacterium]
MALPLRDDHVARQVPWVTFALIAAIVMAFMFVQPAGFQSGAVDSGESQAASWQVRERDEFTYRYGTVACEVVSGETLADQPDQCDRADSSYLPLSKSIPLSLFTALFLHGDIAHLGGNLLFLWVFGARVESRLGPANYLGLYLAGGVVATFGFIAANSTSAVPLIGASGAIAALMGAYLVLVPDGRILTVIFTAAFQVVYLPAAIVLALFFVTQFFTSDESVAWQAHAAGMVAGVLAALALARIPAVKARAEREKSNDQLKAGREF